MAPNHPSIPKADRSRPGEYLPITRENNPGAFRNREEQSEAERRAAETFARMAGETPEEVPSEQEEEPSEDAAEDEESELSEVDDSDSDAPSDALDVDDPTWKVGQPKSQPLSYWVPSDASGGKFLKKLKNSIDFNDKTQVERAVKNRRLTIWRARQKHGLPLARVSTQGRQYTVVHEHSIRTENAAWGAAHNGARIPMAELAIRFNARFPGQNRTAASLSAHMFRNPELMR